MRDMPEDKLHLLPAFLHTWSFAYRAWGLVQPQFIRPYEHDTDAWNLLQLDPLAKSTLQALVEAPRMLSDVIQRKSRGTWILLHGQSGTGASRSAQPQRDRLTYSGKTFCAQAIGALLKRPVIHLSAGELACAAARLGAR